MKKFLLIVLFFFFFLTSLSFFLKGNSFAQTTPAVPAAPAVPDDTWISDAEVTFVGKTAARSGEFLDWALQRYEWSFVTPGKTNPLLPFWIRIRNIIYIFSVIFVLFTAFIIITTRGRSITIARFVPRFIFVLILVTFSFAIIQFIYQISDAIQGFFIRNKANEIISQKDLLYVGFDYQNFTGFRKSGFTNDESVFITLLLTKLTALTYYVMTGALLVRKIILWFFIIVSPIFPILLLYYPVRNTAKIWIGEFFRWLMYGPLFALFLSGLVNLWSTTIPLKFDFTSTGKVPGTDIIYPTAVNILLGGPGQTISIANSVNLPETFALYTIALIMLWAVILLPWVLLQIFLDYLQNISFRDTWAGKHILSTGSSLFRPPLAPAPVAPFPAPPQAPAGKARPLPFLNTAIPRILKRSAGMAREIPIARPQSRPYQVTQSTLAKTEVLRLTNLSIPTMQDIARFETLRLSKDTIKQGEITKTSETLRQIANPASITSVVERERMTQIREKLVQESKQGNIVATNILQAAQSMTKESRHTESEHTQEVLKEIANPAGITNIQAREQVTAIKEKLQKESREGNTLASEILAASQKETSKEELQKITTTLQEKKDKGDPLASTIVDMVEQKEKTEREAVAGILGGAQGIPGVSVPASLPVKNQVQTVSLEDYEAVKKMWGENYQNLEVPQSLSGGGQDRKEWIEGDIAKITSAINLLTALDKQKVSEGMREVSAILPFLLIGGFSQAEIITYLKAKLEAAKSVKEQLAMASEEEETLVEVTEKKEEKAKEMTLAQELPDPLAKTEQKTNDPFENKPES